MEYIALSDANYCDLIDHFDINTICKVRIEKCECLGSFNFLTEHDINNINY